MDKEAFSQFSHGLRGAAYTPGDEGYDEARVVWNGTVTKRPAVIVRCAGVADVIDAVNFAREQGLGVAVRGGGHHVAGSSLIEDGLVVDLSQMRSVRVDPAACTVRAEGGAQIGDVDRETQAFGLVVPLGLVSETGIAGLTLGGGLGWLRRKYGPSCDNLISADVVTSEGKLLHASAAENVDLYWALRGGGWDMGVVVSLEYRAYELGPEVFLAFVTYPRSEGKQVLERFRDAYEVAPLGAAPLAVCWTFPESDPYPKEVWGKDFIGVVGAYAGSLEEGEQAMAAFRNLGTPLFDWSGPAPWLEVQRFFDEDYPKGRRYYWKSSYLKELSGDTIDTVLELADKRPSPLTSLDIWPLGGVGVEVGLEQSPFGHRMAPYAMGFESNWDNPADDAANIAWARDSVDAVARFSTGGSYMNFEDPDDAKATAASYGPAIERLRRVKQQYDPHNLFRSRKGLG